VRRPKRTPEIPSAEKAFKSGSGVYVVVLVGGKGKRLMPLSTDVTPKAFLSVTRDRKTVFKKTIERASRIVSLENILVIANRSHAALVRRDFPEIKDENLVLEPVSRNTAPAVYLASLALSGKGRDVIMAIFPADHYVTDGEGWTAAMKAGMDFARRANGILVVGTKPAYPNTEFGYIKLKSDDLDAECDGICKVEKFMEKPDRDAAERFLKDGRYLWNTGTFIFRAGAFSEAIERYAPQIPRVLKDLKNLDEDYAAMPDISIDYAVIEKADNIYCVEGSFQWQDMGTFENLKKVLKKEGRRFLEEGGKVVKIL
jgi:mannose-1-phosphate guanylyltransferase